MFGKHDITFCSDKDCLRTNCKRHPSKTPKGIPYSMGDLSSHEVYFCKNYWPENVEGYDEQRQP